MTRNAAHLDNFLANPIKDRIVIVDAYKDAFGETKLWEIASGKTVEEAKERFFMRFMLRGAADQEMMIAAQRNNRIKIQAIVGNARELLESDVLLLAH